MSGTNGSVGRERASAGSGETACISLSKAWLSSSSSVGKFFSYSFYENMFQQTHYIGIAGDKTTLEIIQS